MQATACCPVVVVAVAAVHGSGLPSELGSCFQKTRAWKRRSCGSRAFWLACASPGGWQSTRVFDQGTLPESFLRISRRFDSYVKKMVRP